MIPNKNRESRRKLQMSKNLQRLYKENKCSEFSVVVTRMDFAKILGKFTKVKIQYEKSTSRGRRNNQQVTSPNSRLKSNENGMVLLPRTAYSQHPVKKILDAPKTKEVSFRNTSKENTKAKTISTPRQVNNILKENNRLKKTPSKDKHVSSSRMVSNTGVKEYGIVFMTPNNNSNDIVHNKLCLTDLLPCIAKEMLPSEDWCIDYFPKDEEPKDDKVYNRIAAELEDLMCREEPSKTDSTENKLDDFPSIMDILNDNSSGNVNKDNSRNNSTAVKSNLDSSDVEAMLLGKSEQNKSDLNATPMEVDNADVSSLISGVVQLNEETKEDNTTMENPDSPSVLDETLQKGIEEQLPSNFLPAENPNLQSNVEKDDSSVKSDVKTDAKKIVITHVIFKKFKDGKCLKTVTCPKNLKYTLELHGKSVELLGAPKLITSSEDLQVLLQIVDETELDSLYVLH